MLKFITLIFLALPFCSLSQNKFNVSGKIDEQIQKKDVLFLLSEFTSKEYHEIPSFKGEIKNSHFTIKGKLSYPQMYRVRLKSETDKIPYRNGFYFIDGSTSSMMIGSNNDQGETNGKTGNEFKQQFIPYFINNDDKTGNLDKFIFLRGQEFDSKLLSYVHQNTSSYVALWFLIIRFNDNGYSLVQEEILNSFSEKIKSEKLWKTVSLEFQKIRIKMGVKFPSLLLKNTELYEEQFKIEEAQYTLIDFWFSRCKPCLEQLPYLKEIYKKYNTKEFNVIGISTDLTINVVPFWQKRIVENEIPWKNYLDENAKEATQEKIFSFPTNFLLDKMGNVIAKNIELEDLDKFLTMHLNPTILSDPKKH